VRVLHVHSGNLWGGIESFLVTLARTRSASSELSSEFALCFGGRLRDALVASDTPVHDLGAARARAPWSVFRSRRRLRRLLEREAFDVVVTHSPWDHAMFGGVAQRSSATAAFWLHDAVTGRQWLERWAALHRPAFAIANSHYTRETLASVFVDLPCAVHRYPVAAPSTPPTLAERASIRRQLGATDDTVVVIQASRMQAWKGQLRLLRALAQAERSLPWLCVEVGGAQRASELAYAEEVKAEAERLGISDRVRFLGQRSDVPQLLAASDIFCQPNVGPEPFGIVFVEALHAGLPIVTSDFGGAREIVTSDVGYLAGDDKALTESLSLLIRDRDKRQRLGAAGPERANALCDPVRQVAGLAPLLRAMMNGQHPLDDGESGLSGAA
jgi:glycosyltransferase involved in cell wall biosynthesis